MTAKEAWKIASEWLDSQPHAIEFYGHRMPDLCYEFPKAFGFFAIPEKVNRSKPHFVGGISSMVFVMKDDESVLYGDNMSEEQERDLLQSRELKSISVEELDD